jgi:hypothetical protein
VEPVSSITDHSLEWYRANNYRYLVTNDDRRDERDPQLYKAITANAKRLRVFPGAREGKPGPHVEVLDLGQQPDVLAIVRRPAQFGAAMRLLGYEARPGELRPAITPLEGADERVLASGEGLQLNLTWQAMRAMPYDYALFVHVLDDGGRMVANRDTIMRADEYPTSRWQAGEIVVDRADLPLPALPAGTYKLDIGVYRMDSGERLPLMEPEPGTDGTSLLLATIEVR